jgi:hypothetical protein
MAFFLVQIIKLLGAVESYVDPKPLLKKEYSRLSGNQL